MNSAQQKVVQYLDEALATEQAVTRELQSQIAMTPDGAYRGDLETHLDETRQHAVRVGARLDELGQGSNPLTAVVGVAETVLGQVVAFGKAPVNLLRGSGGDEKILKNAKDACASETLEIATYTAIERLARSVGDDETAELAASIRADEEKMLQRIMREIPKLTESVVGADVNDEPSYDLSTTGAADAVREAGETAKNGARKATAATKRSAATTRSAAANRSAATKRSAAAKRSAGTKRTAAHSSAATNGSATADRDAATNRTAASEDVARQARTVPGAGPVAAQLPDTAAPDSDLAIPGFDALSTEEITGKLAGLSQTELAKIDAYEREHESRPPVLNRIASLRGDESTTPSDAADARKADTTAGDHDELRNAAEAGDGAAAFTLWTQLRDTDFAAAEASLRKAADLGDVRAAHTLGMLLWERRDVDAAEARLRSATVDPEGAHALGLLLWRERHDPHAAVESLDRAAQADHPAAQRDLGIVLREHGDLHGAHYWLSRAAERDAEARQALAALSDNR